MNAYAQLLGDAEASPETFVRHSLGRLEADFREMALLALADWERLEIVTPALFSAVAGLQRPSWGSWNGLLSALKKARRGVLREGTAEERAAVEGAATLIAVLSRLEERPPPGLTERLAPLGELTRTSLGKRTRVSHLVALPITLRNRVAHDAPTDEGWWRETADALRPLITWHSEHVPCAFAWAGETFPAPWFLVAEGETLACNGLEHDYSVRYVSMDGRSRHAPEQSRAMLLALQRLLGKADARETDFKKLLSKHAPEEIRGVMLGDYLVGAPVGEGGFAVVHAGRQLSTGRKVAVKVLHDGMPEEARERFQREAAYLSRLDQHPHVVDVIGFGEETWSAPRQWSLSDEPWFEAFSKGAAVKSFIVLGWVEGETLDALIGIAPERRPDLRQIARWFAQAANALEAVHASGMIHRDVKPGNLMVDDQGDVLLMDFGIARTHDESRTLVTEAGSALGTPAYMSPEQIRAADAESEVGPATDVYSLCAAFYELFTATRLYDHDTVAAVTVRTRKLEGVRPERPSLRTRGLPWELETILLGGLEPEAADRYRSAAALERDLVRFLADEPIEYRRPSLWRRMQLGYRRHRRVANIVALFVILALLLAVQIVLARNEALENARAARKQSIRATANADRAEANARRATRNAEIAEERLAEANVRLGYALEEKGLRKAEVGEWGPAAVLLAAALELEDLPLRRLEALRALGRAKGGTWRRRALGSGGRASPEPDGHRVAVASRDGVAVWDVEAGRRITLVPVTPVWSFAWMSGDRVAIRAPGGVSIWSASTGEELGRWPLSSPGIEESRDTVASPDGERLATTAGNGVTRVLPGEISLDGARAIAWSPDGSVIATGTARGVVKLWDPGTGEQLGELFQEAPILRIRWSPDGRRLAVGCAPGASGSGTVQIWDATRASLSDIERVFAPARVATLHGYARGVFALRWSPDGRILASAAGGAGRIRLSRPETGQLIATLHGHRRGVTDLAWSPDGGLVASASTDGTVRVWTRGGIAAATLPADDYVIDVGFAADGSRLLGSGSAVYAWEVPDVPPFARRPPLPDDDRTVAAVAPDGSRLAYAADLRVHIWDLTAEAPAPRAAGGALPATISWSPDGRSIAASGWDAATARVWDTRTGALLSLLIGHRPSELPDRMRFAWTRDGARLATGTNDGSVRIWDPRRGRLVSTVPVRSWVGRRIRRRVESSIGIELAFQRPELVDAKVADLAVPGGLAWTPDGSRIAISSAGEIVTWDPERGDPVALVGTAGIGPLAWSPDGALLAASDGDDVILWRAEAAIPISGVALDDLAPPAPLSVLEGHGDAVTTLRWSPDGTLLASGSKDGAVRLWEVATARLGLAALEGLGAPIRSLAWTPEGLTAAAEGGRVLTWDVDAVLGATTIRSLAERRSGLRLVGLDVEAAPELGEVEDGPAWLVALPEQPPVEASAGKPRTPVAKRLRTARKHLDAGRPTKVTAIAREIAAIGVAVADDRPPPLQQRALARVAILLDRLAAGDRDEQDAAFALLREAITFDLFERRDHDAFRRWSMTLAELGPAIGTLEDRFAERHLEGLRDAVERADGADARRHERELVGSLLASLASGRDDARARIDEHLRRAPPAPWSAGRVSLGRRRAAFTRMLGESRRRELRASSEHARRILPTPEEATSFVSRIARLATRHMVELPERLLEGLSRLGTPPEAGPDDAWRLDEAQLDDELTERRLRVDAEASLPDLLTFVSGLESDGILVRELDAAASSERPSALQVALLLGQPTLAPPPNPESGDPSEGIADRLGAAFAILDRTPPWYPRLRETLAALSKLPALRLARLSIRPGRIELAFSDRSDRADVERFRDQLAIEGSLHHLSSRIGRGSNGEATLTLRLRDDPSHVRDADGHDLAVLATVSAETLPGAIAALRGGAPTDPLSELERAVDARRWTDAVAREADFPLAARSRHVEILLARAAAGLGRHREAEGRLVRLLDQGPPDPEALVALARLRARVDSRRSSVETLDILARAVGWPVFGELLEEPLSAVQVDPRALLRLFERQRRSERRFRADDPFRPH